MERRKHNPVKCLTVCRGCLVAFPERTFISTVCQRAKPSHIGASRLSLQRPPVEGLDIADVDPIRDTFSDEWASIKRNPLQKQ